MKNHTLIKSSILSLTLIMVIVSCEKYNSEKNSMEILDVNNKEIFGEWISEKKCGGWSGGCSNYTGEKLNISEYGDFVILDDLGTYAIGHVKIISQDSINLKVKLDWKQGELRLFSNEELFVTFKSNDTIIFDEGCCDKWSFEFIRKK